MVGQALSQALTHESQITKTSTPRLWLPVLVVPTTLASSSQVPSSTAATKSPDLNLILQRLEDVQHQDPAQSRPYEVTRFQCARALEQMNKEKRVRHARATEGTCSLTVLANTTKRPECTTAILLRFSNENRRVATCHSNGRLQDFSTLPVGAFSRRIKKCASFFGEPTHEKFT
jgi:hypothetical protein